jgi:hypothetical protein
VKPCARCNEQQITINGLREIVAVQRAIIDRLRKQIREENETGTVLRS